jgi:hypothetical protein
LSLLNTRSAIKTGIISILDIVSLLAKFIFFSPKAYNIKIDYCTKYKG